MKKSTSCTCCLNSYLFKNDVLSPDNYFIAISDTKFFTVFFNTKNEPFLHISIEQVRSFSKQRFMCGKSVRKDTKISNRATHFRFLRSVTCCQPNSKDASDYHYSKKIYILHTSEKSCTSSTCCLNSYYITRKKSNNLLSSDNYVT